jgi:hypothetical protein
MMNRLTTLALMTLAGVGITLAQTPAVTFLGEDTTTTGNWKGVYGQDGNYLPDFSANVPAYTLFNPVNVNQRLLDTWVCFSTPCDPRAPLKPQYSYSPTERVKSYNYNRDYEDFQMNTMDNATHRIALYFADYEYFGRSITVTAHNTATGATLDTRLLSSYSGGVYLVYNYTGAVDFKIQDNFPLTDLIPNGTVSAFFWGGSGGPPTQAPAAPVVYFSPTGPAAGSTVSGTVSLQVAVDSGPGVKTVQYYLDGAALGSPQTFFITNILGSPILYPFNYNWDTTTASSGQHTLTARATDVNGLATLSAGLAVIVNNGTSTGGGGGGGTTPPPAPTVTINSISSPVSGTVNISSATNSSVVSVQYQLNGSNLGPLETTAPFTYAWSTATFANGPYSLTAIASDASSNHVTSTAVNVTVNNVAPPSSDTVTFLGKDTTTIGNWKGVYGQDGQFMAQITYNAPSYSKLNPINETEQVLNDYATDPRALLKVQGQFSSTERVESYYAALSSMSFQVNTSDNLTHRIALYFCDYNNTGASVTVNALDTPTGNVLNTQVLASYAGGVYLIYNYQGTITFQVVNNVQTAFPPAATLAALFWGGSGGPPTGGSTGPAPTITITTPGAGTVSGTVSISSSISDSATITGVQYKYNGSNLGAVQTIGPNYTYSWNTTQTSNGGPFALTAVLTDNANSPTTSAGVMITVNNQAAPVAPTITINPVNSTVSGNVTLNATVSASVTKVQYFLDNVALSGVLTSPFSFTWNTTTTSNGAHTITATASTAANVTANATGVPVNVNNVTSPTGNTVTFLRQDTTTLGNWKGSYGQDGVYMAQITYSAPSYASFNPDNEGEVVLNYYATDPRALLKVQGQFSSTERIESYYNALGTMNFAIHSLDTATHRIALYFCDYTSAGQSVTINAVDSTSGKVLNTQVLTNYTAGIYLVYTYSGQVTFNVLNNNSNSGAIAGSVAGFFWGGSN